MHTSCGLLRHALDLGLGLGEPARARRNALFDGGKEVLFFFIGGLRYDGGVLLCLGAEQDVGRGVATVVEDHVGGLAVAEVENLVRIVPVVGQALALDGKNRRASGGDGGSGMVLR